MNIGYDPNYNKDDSILFKRTQQFNYQIEYKLNDNGQSYFIINNNKIKLIIPFSSIDEALDILKKIQLNYTLLEDPGNENNHIGTNNEALKNDILKSLEIINNVYKKANIDKQITIEDVRDYKEGKIRFFDKTTGKVEVFNKDTILKLSEKVEDVLSDFFEWQKGNIKSTYKVSIDELLLDGKELLTTREACEIIVEKTKTTYNGKEVYDLAKCGNNVIQDYLLAYLYGVNLSFDEEQIKAILFYKKGDYHLINSILRGQAPELDSPKELELIVKTIIKISDIINSLPKRNFDLLIRREDGGFNQEIEEGKFNMFPQFVSNTTTDKFSSGTQDNHLTRILYKDESALPIDLVRQFQLDYYGTENEIMTNPFKFQIKNVDIINEHNRNINIEITQSISIYDILLQGINSYKSKLIEKNKSISPEEQDKNNKMIQKIDELVLFIKEREMNPVKEDIKTNPITYFDDKPQQKKEETEKTNNDNMKKKNQAKLKLMYLKKIIASKMNKNKKEKKGFIR